MKCEMWNVIIPLNRVLWIVLIKSFMRIYNYFMFSQKILVRNMSTIEYDIAIQLYITNFYQLVYQAAEDT